MKRTSKQQRSERPFFIYFMVGIKLRIYSVKFQQLMGVMNSQIFLRRLNPFSNLSTILKVRVERS